MITDNQFSDMTLWTGTNRKGSLDLFGFLIGVVDCQGRLVMKLPFLFGHVNCFEYGFFP
jgi:hypothetical protein